MVTRFLLFSAYGCTVSPLDSTMMRFFLIPNLVVRILLTASARFLA